MFSTRRIILALSFMLAAIAPRALAQTEDKPKGFLRQDAGGYFALIRTFAPLPAGSKVFAALTNKAELLDLETEVTDCPTPPAPGVIPTPPPGKICLQMAGAGAELVYRLARAPLADDSLKMRYAVTDSTGQGKLREVAAVPDYKIVNVDLVAHCDNGVEYTVRAENLPDDKSYFEGRILKFDEWLKRQEANPRVMADVETQTLTKAGKAARTIKDFQVIPALDNTPAGRRRLNVAGAQGSKRFNICLKFQEPLPADKFDTLVSFRDDPPFELLSPKFAALDGVSEMASPSADAVVGEKELGLRAFDNSFDLGLIFTSSVANHENEDKTTVRSRKNEGVFDLRFAPWLRDRRTEPRARTWQYLVTPIFLDAKVSTGKITTDTLSLNRVLIGTEHNFRYVTTTRKDKADKYILTLRGINASDRDFKRAELTGEFEFRPIFHQLNRPLKAHGPLITRVLDPDGGKVEGPSTKFFGYQFQPFVGFNAGRTYRHRREAFGGEEASDFVRRLFFGMDTIFNLGPRFTTTLTDTFYVRGETPAHRNRNYFDGELEASLGHIKRNTAQSIYFSFERGDQPPFAGPGVNDLKIGYRIRSDFMKVGTVK